MSVKVDIKSLVYRSWLVIGELWFGLRLSMAKHHCYANGIRWSLNPSRISNPWGMSCHFLSSITRQSLWSKLTSCLRSPTSFKVLVPALQQKSVLVLSNNNIHMPIQACYCLREEVDEKLILNNSRFGKKRGEVINVVLYCFHCIFFTKFILKSWCA